MNTSRFFLALFLFIFFATFANTVYSADLKEKQAKEAEYQKKGMKDLIKSFYKSTGLYGFLNPDSEKIDSGKKEFASNFSKSWGRLIMILISILLFYLAIAKKFEPLLLIPIGFGGLLSNPYS